MLQIKNIVKQYKTGDLVQKALNDVSLSFRENEFVAILGPSGSGKTTLLNIIGGLDRYDDGDLIINGISTKKYKERDWNSYRNHTIGFVFQSYNLIPHQSVLSNVELALTISGVSRKERKKRAVEALEQVGLRDHIHKRPNQLSGGQMQRVAIARALVNNPDILLADEPTGALDSETSVQVMELLKEVARDRLVIMVTHNPELAEQYATRTVYLRDGQILNDTNPYEPEILKEAAPVHKNMGKASMGFLTSLSLSFNNLRTKKARTLLTAFAGSIGIIGIALILSLSNGVTDYIETIQRETMTSYPLTINAESIDLSSMMSESMMMGDSSEAPDHDLDAVYSDSTVLEQVNQITSSLTQNNLTEFKKYLDDPNSEIAQYLGENGVVYSYDVPFGVYSKNEEGKLIDATVNAFSTKNAMSSNELIGSVQESIMDSMPSSSMSSETFVEMMPGSGDSLVSQVTTDSYEVVSGAWPENFDEVVIILDENNEISTPALYALGLIPEETYNEIMDAINSGEALEIETFSYDYDDLLNKRFYLIPACDYYEKNDDGTFDDLRNDQFALERLAEDAIELKVSGIIRPVPDAANADLYGAVGYTSALKQYLIDYAQESDVVKAQLESKDVNVLTGMHFSPQDDEAKIADTKEFLSAMSVSEKAKMFSSMTASMNPQQAGVLSSMDETTIASMADQYFAQAQDEVFLQIYDAYISPGSYEDNLTSFGFVSLDAPSSIHIYADTFEDKDAIAACIENYNAAASEENKIVYTDFVAMMTSSVTVIINVISYVLIAFVAVSLIVSSIMIGIITYISVLERTKEIGVLRAIGASKHNVSQVFNAETFIIGLLAGLLGVGISCLILIPANAVIHVLTENTQINASLPVISGIVLVVLSVILTLIGGLIPSRSAARQDPVKALRSE